MHGEGIKRSKNTGTRSEGPEEKWTRKKTKRRKKQKWQNKGKKGTK